MSKVPAGKVLLRNVIRHTDAHNKIQEESEMWKLRNLERQSTSTHFLKHRGRMHSDQFLEDSEWSVPDRLDSRLSDRDEREAKYWTRKLYEFEANDPDRWGHSGFKELYPEEFLSDGEKDSSERKRKRKDKHKLDDDIHKAARKSSKKKKKKDKKRKRMAESDSETCSEEEDGARRKQKKKEGKSKHRKKAKHKERAEDSDTEDSPSETSRKRSRRQTDQLLERKRRKNWQVEKEERSVQSSDG